MAFWPLSFWQFTIAVIGLFIAFGFGS